MDRTLILTISGALALMLTVLEMVRRRRLEERYCLGWLATSIIVLVLASSRRLLDTLAATMGIAYPPSALLVTGFGALLVAALYFSTVVSRLTRENRSLTQEVAILRWQISEVRRRLAELREP